MKSLRTALLVAAATLAAVPTMAMADSQDRDWRRGDRPNLQRDARPNFEQRGGDRQAPIPQSPPSAPAAPVASPAPTARVDYSRGSGERDRSGGNRNYGQGGEQRFGGDRNNRGEVGSAPRGSGGDRSQWNRGGARPDGDRGAYRGDLRDSDRRDRDRNGAGNSDRGDRRDDRQWRGGGRNDRDWNRDGRSDRTDGRWGNGDRNDGRWNGGGRNDGRWTNDGRYAGSRFRPDQHWRNDSRYNWQSYRNTHRDIFRRGRYNPPRGYGYGYRSVSRGFFLEPFFYASSYWLADPYQYRLPPAEWPYRWVRYYDDALLVDTTNGEVVDVIQNFFY